VKVVDNSGLESHVGWAKAVRDMGKEFELTTALPTIRVVLKHRMVGKFRGNYVPTNEIHWTELAHPTRLLK